MSLPLSEHTGYLLRVAHDQAHMAAAAVMPRGLHPRLFGLLTALLESAPLSQQQLAEKMRVNRTLVVGIVDDLEQRGWVERRRDPADRRRHIVEITGAGCVAAAEVEQAIAEVEQDAFAQLDENEIGQLRSLLARVHTRTDGDTC
jgi:DNA-binding MarR family transcriptional regulator